MTTKKCVSCSDTSVLGKARCQRCLDRCKDAQKNLRDRRVAEGICTVCGSFPALSGRTACQACVPRRNKKAGDLKKERKDAGFCTRCGTKNDNECNHCDECRKKDSERSSEQRQELKTVVMAHYGKSGEPVCCWPDCQMGDLDMLTIDHIKDDGAEDRKKNGKGGDYLYRSLIAKNFPEGYQTLCWNHQWKKRLAGWPTID